MSYAIDGIRQILVMYTPAQKSILASKLEVPVGVLTERSSFDLNFGARLFCGRER